MFRFFTKERETTGVPRRIVKIWIVIFVAFFVFSAPASAAGFVHAWFTHVHALGDSLVTFVKDL